MGENERKEKRPKARPPVKNDWDRSQGTLSAEQLPGSRRFTLRVEPTLQPEGGNKDRIRARETVQTDVKLLSVAARSRYDRAHARIESSEFVGKSSRA